MGLGRLHNFFCTSGFRPMYKKGVHLIAHDPFHCYGYCSYRVGKTRFFGFLMGMIVLVEFLLCYTMIF